jgi:hypothetical protein
MLVLPKGWRSEGPLESTVTPWGAPGVWLAEAGQVRLRRAWAIESEEITGSPQDPHGEFSDP